jgi:hypothetical protein
LALDGFHTATITIIGIAIVFLYMVLWRKAEDRIKDLNSVEGQQGLIWLGDIWMTNIKQGVQDFYAYVNTNIAEMESEDKLEELFSHTSKKPVLEKKLQDLTDSYQKFLESASLLGKSRESHELIKTWTLRTILSLFLIGVWGSVGFLIDVSSNSYWIYYWIGIIPLLLLLSSFSIMVAKSYENCCSIDSRITAEKSKHADALGVKL